MKLRRIAVALVLGALTFTMATNEAKAQVNQTVDANINSALALAITTPFASNPWILNQGANTESSLRLTAQANVGYALRTSCDTVATKAGFENNLFEFLAGVYVAAGRLINANLQIRALGAGAAVDILPTAAGDTMVNAGGQTPTPSAGRVHSVELSQFVDFGDQSLSGGAMYHMVITYTIIAGAV
jgi:hypothetical protein